VRADLVLTNGKVRAGDARRSRHGALAVKDGRIVALGSAADAAGWAGPRTRTVDLGGRLVLPGFVDAHMHPICAVSELYEVSLADCGSVEECLGRVAAFATAHPESPVIRGYGWFPTRVPMEGMTAEALDRAAAGRPVLLNDDNVHAQWVSSEVLRRAGVGREEPDWPGAVVERLPDGAPKGLLHEAYPWVDRALPAYTAAQHEAAFAHFRKEIVSRYGITCLHEAGIYGSDAVLDAYERLERDDELGVRLQLAVMLDPDRPVGEQVEEALQVRRRFDGPLVRAVTAKLMVDGVIETRTAYLAEPYDDRPGFRGEPVWPPELLVEASRAAAAAGFQLHYHVIGDAALSLALDAVEAARAGGGGGARRARDLVTHVQVADPRDYRRMAAAGVAAVMQPYWFTKDPGYDAALHRLIGDRADRLYPMRSLLEAGVAVAAASDYPVTPPPDPLLAIQRGVLRRDPLTGVDAELWPEEAVSVEDMVEAFTIAGARANFLEDETGSLEVGKSADLVVLSEDLFALPPEHIHESAVELTLFRGRPTYSAGRFAGLAPG
jgi:predicted amidohydrolase YtcJ